MTLWIWVSLAAAAVQTLRFMLQKRLKGLGLSTGGATFSRFVFAVPFAIGGAVLLMTLQGVAMPDLPMRFFLFGMAGGLAQIVATFCTVMLFSLRSFAVGIAFTKTELVQVAIFSALLLGEPVSPPGWVAIVIGVVGVIILSPPPKGATGGAFGKAVALGLLAGGLFGLSAIGYRGATQALALDSAFLRAVIALAFVISFQTLAMTVWLLWREPGEIGRVMRAWRATLPVGVTGVLGSMGWFTAFALQNAAYVRGLGQIELLFSLLASALVFRERISGREIVGMILLVVSILVIILMV